MDLSSSECDGMSVYSCVALLMYQFVLFVACLTVFVNCLMQQFAMCLGVVAVLLLNVMDVMECAFTSSVRTECGMFVMYCMQCCMSVSAVL